MILSLIVVLVTIMTIIGTSNSLTMFHHKYHPLPPMEFTEYNKLLIRNHHRISNDKELTYDDIKPKKTIRSINMKTRTHTRTQVLEYNKPQQSSFYKEKVMDIYESGMPVYYETIFSGDYGFIQKYVFSDNDNNNYTILYQKSTGLLVEYSIERKDEDTVYSIQNQYQDHDATFEFPHNNDPITCPNGFPELDDINFDDIEEEAQEYNTLAYIRHPIDNSYGSLINDKDGDEFNTDNINEEFENANDNDDTIDNNLNEEFEEMDDTFDYDTLLICVAIIVQLVICSKVIDIVKGNINIKNEITYESASNPFDQASKFTSLLSTISCPNSPIRISRSNNSSLEDRSPIRAVLNN